jgi:hypothetical protein
MFHQQCLNAENILLWIMDTHVSAFETWAAPIIENIHLLLCLVK